MHLKKLILDTFFAERKKFSGNRQLKEIWKVKVVEVVRRLETAERFPSIHIHIWSEPAPGSFIIFLIGPNLLQVRSLSSSSVRTAPQFIHYLPHRSEPVPGSFISPFPRHSSLLHIITIPSSVLPHIFQFHAHIFLPVYFLFFSLYFLHKNSIQYES